VERCTLSDVTVVIPLFGDAKPWLDMAARAALSVVRQTVHPSDLVVSVGATLQEARNRPGLRASTEWLCFLDADDELDPYYIEAMLAGDGDVRQPATLGIVDGVEDDYPVLIPPRPLEVSNYIVIGAFVRTELFQRVGGFRDYEAFEDWDLWRRCAAAGGRIEPVPEAIYRVHVRANSRNSLDRPGALEAYNVIRRSRL
jgi:hypothetical protein